MSTEVAYYTYIYAKVDKDEYKKVTSYTYTAILVGNFGAAVLSQFLVSSKWMNYHQLNYLTLGGVSIALIIALFLPRVQKSIYFYRKENLSDEIETRDVASISRYESLTLAQRVQRAYRMLWYDFVKAYSNMYVVKWSVWWAIASAGYLQVRKHSQFSYEG
jgi:thiamine transporter 2/3